MKRKHIPQRTCIGCRQVRAKREMIRVVRTPKGGLVIDETGKQNGRGAYLCPARSCWMAALKGDRLSKALNIKIGDIEKEMLQNYASTLAK